MSDRISLGRIAMRNALQLRRDLSIPRESPANVYDVASAIGVEVRFLDRPSLEGMFYRGPHPVVLLPCWAHRPKGRISYSCAHELGHFQLGHGTHVDEYLETEQQQKSNDEYAADIFAANLLMPRQAVTRRFSVRDWSIADATPLQLFAVAGELDVGYTTLLKHLRFGLELVNNSWLESKIRVSPKRIRQDVMRGSDAPPITLADDCWSDVPIDLEVGSVIAVPSHLKAEAVGSLQASGSHETFSFWTGVKAGETELHIDDKSIRVRVARSGFCGMLKYRYLIDPDEP